jgi:serine/threonine protein kinase/Tol biopolymer transport system component
MKPERYKQIDEVFQAALQKDEHQRAEFVVRACGGDLELKRTVEALLASDRRAQTFIEKPAVEMALSFLSEENESLVEQSIGPYRIVDLLGSGGMGTVYLAQDPRLGRNVAVKLLPNDFNRDQNSMLRFRQEARAASALNHPNIITIYEFGESDGRQYIVSELVDGKTVRQLIAQRAMTTAEAIDVAVAVAEALASAHRAGIVHRDIKPENIMLRSDGYVKVLDFGLAKLMDGVRPFNQTDAPVTEPGTVMGTATYMSPEQLRGFDVDGRTDIWSLGGVLYEMLSGKAPFEAPSRGDLIVSILEREPPTLSLRSNPISAALGKILARSLAKNRSERYKTVDEMLVDLRKLKLLVEVETDPELSAIDLTTGSKNVLNTLEEAVGSGQRSYITSTVETLGRHRIWLLIAVAALLIPAGIVGLNRWQRRAPSASQPAFSFQAENIVRLTASGNVTHAAISPDGKYVAYATREGGQYSLWVRQVAATVHRKILEPSSSPITGVTFSPDSGSIYYSAGETATSLRTLYQVSILGEASRKILTDIDSSITFSPDGARFAFMRISADAKERSLVLRSVDETSEQVLAVSQLPEEFSDTGPSWSPDGSTIATVVLRTSETGVRYSTVGEVRVEDGSLRLITSRRWRWIGQVQWLRDGRGLLMPVAGDQSTIGQLVELSYPSGEARTISSELSSYLYPLSLSSDSISLVAVQRDRLTNLWKTGRGGDFSQAEQITHGIGRHYAISWTPDGRLLYVSDESGNWDVWISRGDGTGQRQLTIDPDIDYAPAITADGRHVVFVSNRGGGFSIWRMETDGGNLKQLTHGSADHAPQCSPDGSVLYTALDSGQPVVWKVGIDGGEPVRLSSLPMKSPVPSPDGRLIVSAYGTEPGVSWQIGLFDLKGDLGSPARTLDFPPNVPAPSRWSPDGRSVAYIRSENSAYNIWVHSIEGNRSRQLTHFKEDQVFAFDWSADSGLAVVRGKLIQDVVLLRDSQP